MTTAHDGAKPDSLFKNKAMILHYGIIVKVHRCVRMASHDPRRQSYLHYQIITTLTLPTTAGYPICLSLSSIRPPVYPSTTTPGHQLTTPTQANSALNQNSTCMNDITCGII